MSQSQVQRKLRERREKMGIFDEPKEEKKHKQIEKPKNNQQFQNKRKMVEGIFNPIGKAATNNQPPKQKQKIQGNPDGFKNARQLLEQQLAGKQGGSSIPSSMPLPQIPLGNLPLPPLLNTLPNLPPPPSLSDLPPPPSLSGLLPPPPPPSFSNLLPPPPLQVLLPPQTINKPLPKQQPKKQHHQRKPIYQEQQHHQKKPIYQEQQHQPTFIIKNNQPSNQHFPPQPPKKVEQQETKVRHTKRKIFQKTNLSPLTKQFFGKDLSSFIKQQFFKEVDILSVINFKVTKKLHKFDFPSIENKHRQIEGIQTLYADSAHLDLVSCYMQKNMNAIKPHNEARNAFVEKLKTYDWTADKDRLKAIKDTANHAPNDIIYHQLNFVQIKNCLTRCLNLKNTYIKLQNYTLCQQIKQIQASTMKMTEAYCKDPANNFKLYDQIEDNINRIKEIK